MKRFLKITLIIVLLGYLIAAFILIGKKDSSVICHKFHIVVTDSTECNLIKADELRYYLDERGLLPEGKKLGEISTSQIEYAINEIDLLTNTECYYKSNGEAYLYVSQKRPIMRVRTYDGDDYYVDANGQYIATDTMYAAYVPLVTGYLDEVVTPASLLPMIQYIDAHEFWQAQTAQIYVHPNRDILIYPRVGNHVIMLGNSDNYEKKLNAVLELYRQHMPSVGWAAYDTISVKYKDQIICTRRDKSYRHNSWN